ncbi:MAG TPA: succinate dehydrogenase, hydrophobic membrane anchor protein [Sphingomicrobium sp.]|nr:succinate dehydrogenase, hydrophobic membrane anchor protein [Sphingomicrobium sp.]
MSAQDLSTPLGRVRALGSAHHGGGHWLRERLTSAALLLLGTWFLASLVLLPALDHKTVADWLKSPSGAVPMALFVIIAFIHAIDGLKVVVDDYVHDAGNNAFLNGLILFAGIGAAALALFSLARVAFGAGA